MKNKKVLGGLFVLLTSAFCLPNLTSCSYGVDDLTGYVANIENASSIGIGSINTSNTNVKKQKNVVRKENNQDNEYLLTATENENGEINYEELIFTKFESGFEEINGEENYIAKREEDINTKINSIQHGVVNIKSKNGFEYRLIDKNGNSLTDWKTGEKGNTKFYDITEDKENITIESRSEKGKISFFVNEGFKYTISLNDKIIIENMEDNDNNDVNKKQGVITLDNLEGDKTYLVKYHGKGKKKTLTQDQMKSKIIRVYVSGGFTFITLISKDSKDQEVPYDLTGDSNFFIGKNSFQFPNISYVIDNESGHIYSLDNIYIKCTRDGMVKAAYEEKLSYLLYDLSVNEKNELVFLPLIAKEGICGNDFFEDKYGRKYVSADILETEIFDEEKNMLVYKQDDLSNIPFYCQNSNNETVKIERDKINNKIFKFYVLDENGLKRELNENDNFYIYINDYKKIKVENGWIKEIGYSKSYSKFGDYSNNIMEFKLSNLDLTESYNLGDKLLRNGENANLLDGYFIKQINIDFFNENNILYFKDNDFYCLEDIWNFMSGKTDKKEYKILGNCRVDYDMNNNFFRLMKTGINGDIYYNLVKTKENGKVKYEVVEAGSYIATAEEIILQPLN